MCATKIYKFQRTCIQRTIDQGLLAVCEGKQAHARMVSLHYAQVLEPTLSYNNSHFTASYFILNGAF